MPANIGSQSVYVKFFDPVDSSVVNHIGVDVRKVGIYSGGYLTRVSDAFVNLSQLSVEIGDGTYQVKITTGAVVQVPISIGATAIVLRWIYTGSASADYMDFVSVAPASILPNDIVVGVGNYVGSALQTGFDYTLRTTPQVFDLFLKVEPTVPTTMTIRVRAGRVNYGSVNYDVVDQLTSSFVAPGSGSRIDVIYVDTDGNVKVLPGTPSGSPVPPDYIGKVALAQITIPSGASSITASMIKDVRSFVSGNVTFPITTAGAVYGSALFALSGTPPGAGLMPVANIGGLFGARVAKSAEATYQAATDGFLVGYGTMSTGGGGGGQLIISSDASATPVTTVYSSFVAGTTDTGGHGFCVPIKKLDYYKCSGSGNYSYTLIQFIPVGS